MGVDITPTRVGSGEKKGECNTLSRSYRIEDGHKLIRANIMLCLDGLS